METLLLLVLGLLLQGLGLYQESSSHSAVLHSALSAARLDC